MEKKVLRLAISNTSILRPSLINGKRNEFRFGEKLGIIFFKLVKGLMKGSLAKYQLIDADTIANAMIYLANNSSKQRIFESSELQEIGK